MVELLFTELLDPKEIGLAHYECDVPLLLISKDHLELAIAHENESLYLFLINKVIDKAVVIPINFDWRIDEPLVGLVILTHFVPVHVVALRRLVNVVGQVGADLELVVEHAQGEIVEGRLAIFVHQVEDVGVSIWVLLG